MSAFQENTMSAAKGRVSLDTSFAEGGIKHISFPGGSVAATRALAMVASGLTYAVGNYEEIDPPGYWITRFNAQGVTDTTFGNNGFVVDKFGPAEFSFALGITVLQSGDILVTGTTGSGYSALALYNPSGSPKLLFGDSGKVILKEMPDLPSGAASLAPTQAAQSASSNSSSIELPGGGLLVLANHYSAAGTTAMIYRLKADGSLDTTLNGKGHIALHHPEHEVGSTLIEQLRVQADGKWLGSGRLRGTSAHASLLVRCNEDGSLDASFGRGGFQLINVTTATQTQLLQRADGRIVAVGLNYLPPLTGLLFGHTANGAPDLEFNAGQPLRVLLNNQPTLLHTAQFDASGKLLVAGACLDPLDESASLSLARFEQTGELDKSFNSQGWAQFAIGEGDSMAEALLIQPDGKLLVAGSTGTGGFVLRLSEA